MEGKVLLAVAGRCDGDELLAVAISGACFVIVGVPSAALLLLMSLAKCCSATGICIKFSASLLVKFCDSLLSLESEGIKWAS